MRSRSVRWPLVAAATLACPFIAGAGPLTTPLMPANGTDSVTCLATNVGNNQAQVTITAKNQFGGTQTPVSSVCPNPLDVGDTCQANYGASVDVWCSFEAKGKVKASINLMDSGGNPVSSLLATK